MKRIIPVHDVLYFGTLRFYPKAGIGVSIAEVFDKRYRGKKYAVLEINPYDLFDSLTRKTYITSDYLAGDPIYIYPEVRLSRDLIRKSGYNITRLKEKAEYYLIPEPDYNEFTDRRYHIACKHNDELYLFTVTDDYNRDVPDDKFEEAKAKIRQELNDENVEFLCDSMSLKKCSFMPQYEAYKDIIEKGDVSDFVFDSLIKLVPNVDISVETLEVWRRLDDKNMLSKFICASNWEEYPFTLRVFLNAEVYGIKYQPNNNIRMILKKIGLLDPDKDDTKRIVTEKDYNMLMAYIFHRLGKEPGPTYITKDEYESLHSEYRKYIQWKVAVAPKKFNGEELAINIK